MVQREPKDIQVQLLSSIAVLEMFQGMWLARSIYIVTKLGIPVLLRDGPCSSIDLAAVTKTHEPSLYRLLRGLASVGIFSEVERGQFAQTQFSRVLCPNVPGSIYHWILVFGDAWQWRPWEDLDYSIQTGETAFSRYHGVNIWGYLNEHPAAEKDFGLGMTDFSQIVNEPITLAYDFSSSTLVDIGGGHGSFLTSILRLYPEMKGTLFERPAVIEEAKKHIAEDLKERCTLIGGNFFEGVPEGIDVYIIKQCLHNWDDEHSIKLLNVCRKAMRPESKILVVDRVIVSDKEHDPFNTLNKFWDIIMLAVAGGRERTEDEFARIYEASGFKLTRIIRTHTPLSIVEGIPS
jgi:hypothetical protein